jgi:septal ring factor EnvC (AmiA/AmiB activator)
MEAMVATPVEDGQHVLSSTEVVSNVLPGSSKFLHNAGLLPASKRSNTRTISTRMQELQTQLDTERQEKNGFREEMETLKAQSQASEATIANQSTEIADLKKSLSENNSLLRQILSINRGQMTPP